MEYLGRQSWFVLFRLCRLLQLCEEEDDATSPLAAPKPEPNDQNLQVGESLVFHEGFTVNQGQHELGFPLADQCKSSPSGVRNAAANNLEGANHLDYHQFELHQEFEHNFYTCFNSTALSGEDALPHVSTYLPVFALHPLLSWAQRCTLGLPKACSRIGLVARLLQ
ncbi:transcription factor VOZ1 [Prunus yedoensis var. nudiflora]|uniref:Transcription factor VOZ1 n=1 Tax=Prunus yedoensis var. nudiflora TaxID=2094558 RepID=A0A314YJI1_PRUYE|nr:transcription factor VOZ1 [Prunus yedoensis var. nudiflora]